MRRRLLSSTLLSLALPLALAGNGCHYYGDDDWEQCGDEDADGLDDCWAEDLCGTDDDEPDSDGDGILDGDEDNDGDGVDNADECNGGSDPNDPGSTPVDPAEGEGDGEGEGEPAEGEGEGEPAEGEGEGEPGADEGGCASTGASAWSAIGALAFVLVGRRRPRLM